MHVTIKTGMTALAMAALLSAGAVTAAASAATTPAPAAPRHAAATQAAPVASRARPAGVRPATSTEGCPLGDVCLYPENKGWNGGHPEHAWYHYGVYNLSGEYGTHYFFNNQTGGAEGAFCTGYNASGTCYYQPAGTWSADNFTPINSVLLAP